MIGKIVSAVAGRSVARTVGGSAAGPAGALIGAALPVVLPAFARRLGPAGMVAAAVGGLLFKRWLERRNARLAVAGDRTHDHQVATRVGEEQHVGAMGQVVGQVIGRATGATYDSPTGAR